MAGASDRQHASVIQLEVKMSPVVVIKTCRTGNCVIGRKKKSMNVLKIRVMNNTIWTVKIKYL